MYAPSFTLLVDWGNQITNYKEILRVGKINKQTVETVKTVLIAVLVTAIIAFVGGMKYQTREQAQAYAKAEAMLKAE